MLLSGGVLRSAVWTQMCADIFARPLEIDANEHASLMGGAVLAMERLGVLRDVRAFAPVSRRTVLPDDTKAALYAGRFRRYLEYYQDPTLL